MFRALLTDDDLTRDSDLSDWRTFCDAYYEPVRRAFLLMRVGEQAVDDLTNSFFLKAAENEFLEKYREFQGREAVAGRKTKFRRYLYRSLSNHVIDEQRGTSRKKEKSLDEAGESSLPGAPVRSLDPDAIYALDVLHQALQALRRHCERTGKPHLWTFFEETFLADEFRGRAGRSRAELLASFPGKDAQFLDNALVTAKRAFRRFVQEVMPREFREAEDGSSRFDEWMAILRESNASQFNLLHLAYRVEPYLAAEHSQAPSMALVVADGHLARYEEPSLEPSEDELAILLSFRLEMPLTEVLDPAELRRYVPASSPLWPRSPRLASRTGAGAAARPRHSLSILTLIDPTPDEASALGSVDVVGLLDRLKSQAKQLRKRPDHAMPRVFAQLFYTIVSVVALVRYRTELHTIGQDNLVHNVRWFLKQNWLDDRVRTLFTEHLAALEAESSRA